MNPDQVRQQGQSSHLFLVRLWREEAVEPEAVEAVEVGGVQGWEWRGRIQQVLSGEVHPFHDWPTLINLLLEMAESEPIGPVAPVVDRTENDGRWTSFEQPDGKGKVL